MTTKQTHQNGQELEQYQPVLAIRELLELEVLKRQKIIESLREKRGHPYLTSYMFRESCYG